MSRQVGPDCVCIRNSSRAPFALLLLGHLPMRPSHRSRIAHQALLLRERYGVVEHHRAAEALEEGSPIPIAACPLDVNHEEAIGAVERASERRNGRRYVSEFPPFMAYWSRVQ